MEDKPVEGCISISLKLSIQDSDDIFCWDVLSKKILSACLSLLLVCVPLQASRSTTFSKNILCKQSNEKGFINKLRIKEIPQP